MNSEHVYTTSDGDVPDDAWDVFLPDGEQEPLPEEGDFWFELFDDRDP